ncbi:MAG: hypothetical protein WC770_05915 [Phycisphaerae bacterium]|jgi:hypothetical protein
MKLILFYLICIYLIPAAFAKVNDVNSLTIEQCRARILELENIVRSQQDKIEKLTAALNKYKQPEIKSVGINLSDGIIYHNKKRSSQWFNYWYDEFMDKIVYHNGRYMEISPQKYSCDILRGISDDEAIVSIRGYNENEKGEIFYNKCCHIKGAYKQLIDSQSFSSFSFEGYLFDNGKYQCKTTTGAMETVTSYIIIKHKSLTKEQFADAINNGFELTQKVKVGDKIITKPVP